jgi:serine/threonine protein kinase
MASISTEGLGNGLMQVENYTIEKELSRGPITTVFLATQIALDRPVLLKILNVQWKGEKDLVERFRREAKICARLKHPNIVNIFDFGTTANSFYLAMEYVEGGNLGEFIKKYHPLPFKIIEYIFHELLKGIEYAHGQGVIHRDIKPANIMIGKDGSVKISDFGLATIADFPALTEMGGTVGTPAYMSPEQAEGQKLSPQSDLFSLGTTIYELTCAENPFMGENFAESIQQVLNKKQRPLIKKRPDTPQSFSDLIQRLLEKHPQKRIGSATEIIQKLKSNSQLPDPTALTDFIKEPSSHAVETTRGDSGKLLNKPMTIYISVFVLVLVIVSIFFFRSDNESVGAVNNPVTEKRNLVDSIQIVNEPKTEPNEQKELSADTKAPEKEVVKDQESSPEKPPEDVEETDFASQNEVDTAEPKYGAIFISTYPWAKIYIDGKYQETTPLIEPIPLEAGEYSLKLENPNFASMERKIIVQPELVDTLSFNLEPATGFLDVQVIPWAEIYINGEYKETTPLNEPISLPAGKHELKFVNPNFSTWIDSIRIEPGQTFNKRISLLKKG